MTSTMTFSCWSSVASCALLLGCCQGPDHCPPLLPSCPDWDLKCSWSRLRPNFPLAGTLPYDTTFKIPPKNLFRSAIFLTRAGFDISCAPPIGVLQIRSSLTRPEDTDIALVLVERVTFFTLACTYQMLFSACRVVRSVETSHPLLHSQQERHYLAACSSFACLQSQ